MNSYKLLNTDGVDNSTPSRDYFVTCPTSIASIGDYNGVGAANYIAVYNDTVPPAPIDLFGSVQCLHNGTYSALPVLDGMTVRAFNTSDPNGVVTGMTIRDMSIYATSPVLGNTTGLLIDNIMNTNSSSPLPNYFSGQVTGIKIINMYGQIVNSIVVDLSSNTSTPTDNTGLLINSIQASNEGRGITIQNVNSPFRSYGVYLSSIQGIGITTGMCISTVSGQVGAAGVHISSVTCTGTGSSAYVAKGMYIGKVSGGGTYSYGVHQQWFSGTSTINVLEDRLELGAFASVSNPATDLPTLMLTGNIRFGNMGNYQSMTLGNNTPHIVRLTTLTGIILTIAPGLLPGVYFKIILSNSGTVVTVTATSGNINNGTSSAPTQVITASAQEDMWELIVLGFNYYSLRKITN
jgi:hypothetical protein